MTQNQLKKLVHYEPTTGVFTRINTSKYSSYNDGDVINRINDEGYPSSYIGGKTYRLHRLAFLYMIGSMPKHTVDHINHIKIDNRWVNLRDVTGAENMRNQSINAKNKSGHNGVHWHKRHSKWCANIFYQGKIVSLGSYDNISDAIAARKEADIKYGFHLNHGT